MAGNGYSFVTDRGFRAFAQDLDQGPWGEVDLTQYDTDTGMAGAPLITAPMMVVWKLRIVWGIRSLVTAMGPDVLGDHDLEWDSAQRAFNLAVASAEEHKVPAVRAAAGRVRKALLSGGGTGQTSLGYEQEVDFGRDQVKLATSAPLMADVATIGAEGHIERISQATEAFAKALGREGNKGRAPSRARRLRAAIGTCSVGFNAVHESITWAIEHTANFDERARLEALLAPFEALVERYATPAAAKAADEGAAEEDEPVDEAADTVPQKPIDPAAKPS